jgi:hypothetical protein
MPKKTGLANACTKKNDINNKKIKILLLKFVLKNLCIKNVINKIRHTIPPSEYICKK